MERQELIEQIERERKNQEINLKHAEALWRLFKNEDFQFLINDYYFTLYLQRLTKEDLASAVAEQTKTAAVDRIKAIGLFDQFLKMVDAQGAQAKAFLSASEEELVNIYSYRGE